MAIITDEERQAFAWLQGRLVELLLLHDEGRFDQLFAERAADPYNTDDGIARYRELAVLFYLREELFESIVPRIKRHLSFAAPRETHTEALPTRGRIDWARTATAARTLPGEIALEVETRHRRRHFATPENLLTVVTLLDYRAAANRVLDDEAARDSTHAIHHPLTQIVADCTRELAFLQFAGLVAECEEIIGGYADRTPDDLDAQVSDNLVRGGNSAYADLLEWRRKLRELRLLDRTAEHEPQPMLGADPARDNYLYQLWLFYEMGALLKKEASIVQWDVPNMRISYVWQGIAYILQHDRAIPDIPRYWGKDAPGVRPDFYIQRQDRQTVRDGDSVIWHAPGFVLDAKYYKPRDSDKTPSSPVKRMIADLQLTGERNGALLFAFQGREIADDDAAGLEDTLRADHKDFLAPLATSAQYTQPDVRILLRRIRPNLTDTTLQPTHDTLLNLFEMVHMALKDPIEVRCHGVFLDSLSATAHGQIADLSALRTRSSTASVGELLLCPKPHVAAWRVDVVSVEQDCCRNAAVCHVKAMPDVKPPQRLTRLEDIEKAIRRVADDDEQAAHIATQQVETIARRYADLLQPDMALFHEQIRHDFDFSDDLFDTTPLLTAAQRDTLALACFLEAQIRSVRATNYAGPALLFSGVLEDVTRHSIHPKLGLFPDSRDQTLGKLGNCRYGGNWQAARRTIIEAQHWDERSTRLSLQNWFATIAQISTARNIAAHSAFLDKAAFDDVRRDLFGGRHHGWGALNGLIIAWQA